MRACRELVTKTTIIAKVTARKILKPESKKTTRPANPARKIKPSQRQTSVRPRGSSAGSWVKLRVRRWTIMKIDR